MPDRSYGPVCQLHPLPPRLTYLHDNSRADERTILASLDERWYRVRTSISHLTSAQTNCQPNIKLGLQLTSSDKDNTKTKWSLASTVEESESDWAPSRITNPYQFEQYLQIYAAFAPYQSYLVTEFSESRSWASCTSSKECDWRRQQTQCWTAGKQIPCDYSPAWMWSSGLWFSQASTKFLPSEHGLQWVRHKSMTGLIFGLRSHFAFIFSQLLKTEVLVKVDCQFIAYFFTILLANWQVQNWFFRKNHRKIPGQWYVTKWPSAFVWSIHKLAFTKINKGYLQINRCAYTNLPFVLHFVNNKTFSIRLRNYFLWLLFIH